MNSERNVIRRIFSDTHGKILYFIAGITLLAYSTINVPENSKEYEQLRQSANRYADINRDGILGEDELIEFGRELSIIDDNTPLTLDQIRPRALHPSYEALKKYIAEREDNF